MKLYIHDLFIKIKRFQNSQIVAGFHTKKPYGLSGIRNSFKIVHPDK